MSDKDGLDTQALALRVGRIGFDWEWCLDLRIGRFGLKDSEDSVGGLALRVVRIGFDDWVVWVRELGGGFGIEA